MTPWAPRWWKKTLWWPRRKETRCFAMGCTQKAATDKVYFTDHHLDGFDPAGLDVRACIRLCQECDDTLHGVATA